MLPEIVCATFTMGRYNRPAWTTGLQLAAIYYFWRLGSVLIHSLITTLAVSLHSNTGQTPKCERW